MGLDLRILPEHTANCSMNLSSDVISFARDYDLFNLIEEVEKEDSYKEPKGVSCFLARSTDGDYKYGTAFETPYGDKIKYMFQRDFLKAVENYETSNWRNKAILAYLKELPPNLKIWLFWH